VLTLLQHGLLLSTVRLDGGRGKSSLLAQCVSDRHRSCQHCRNIRVRLHSLCWIGLDTALVLLCYGSCRSGQPPGVASIRRTFGLWDCAAAHAASGST
jgi:hypothetical protein